MTTLPVHLVQTSHRIEVTALDDMGEEIVAARVDAHSFNLGTDEVGPHVAVSFPGRHHGILTSVVWECVECDARGDVPFGSVERLSGHRLGIDVPVEIEDGEDN